MRSVGLAVDVKYLGLAVCLLFGGALQVAAGAPETITLALQRAEPASAAAAIAEQIGAEVHFFSAGKVSLDIKDVPAEQALTLLGKFGALVVFHPVGEAGNRERLAGNCTLVAENVSPQVMSQALSALLEVPVTFASPGNGQVSLDVKGMPVRQLLKILEAQGRLSY
jgi:hypothetical protein